MPQPKDPSRRALEERASGGCLSRLFASRGLFLTLLQGCLSRLFASRGFKGVDTSRDRDEEKTLREDLSLREDGSLARMFREDESLARVPPLEGIDQLGEEEIGQGIKVIKQEAAHVRRSKKLKSRGPAPLPSPTTAPRHFRDPAPLPRPHAISAAPI